MEDPSVSIIRSCCVGRRLSWEAKGSIGAFNSIIICWDPTNFNKLDSFVGEFSVSIHLEDHIYIQPWMLTSIYGPCDDSRKPDFLSKIQLLRGKWCDRWCICEDFELIKSKFFCVF